MKVLIVPDIHTKVEAVDDLIVRNQPDKIILLGDIFDDFGDNAEIARQCAVWLKPKLHDPKITVIWGNHDLMY